MRTAARRLFLRDKQTKLNAADIRRGSWSAQLNCVIREVANSKTSLQVLELQDEAIDDSVRKLKKFQRDTNATITSDSAQVPQKSTRHQLRLLFQLLFGSRLL